MKLDFRITNAYATPAISSENLEVLDSGEQDGAVQVLGNNSAGVGGTEVLHHKDETSAAEVLDSAVISGLAEIRASVSNTEPVAVEHHKQSDCFHAGSNEPKEEKSLEQSKQEIATAELRNFVISTLAPKLDEMKSALLQKLATQEEQLASKIKKLEGDEEKQLAVHGTAEKVKKDVKVVKGKK
ncbi:hypothetical protein HK100_012952 [Physocladia obscura]|uniref:Uncharacterized protein n=1 Tax=Physocladia obscura TaxID=109957 RepID=A0AAD5T0R5_9FUNG|nr:hypothetical protein HK100_012952 [Physocladia obscura]